MTPHLAQVVFSVLALMTQLALAPLLVCADDYHIDVTADVEQGRANGKMTLRYQNSGKQPLDKLRLRLDENLSSAGATTISSVRDQHGGELSWRYVPFAFGTMTSERAQLEIDLPEALPTGGNVELQVEFLLDDARCLNHEMTTLQDDPYHSFDAWYPKAMTQADGKWSINDDRISEYTVTICLPNAFKALASTGKAVRAWPDDGGHRIVRLKAEGVRGFTIFASPAWEEHRRIADGVDLGVYLPSEASDWAERVLDAAADVIAFYRSEYGEFPGDHLEIICPGSLSGQAHGSSATCNGITVWLHPQFERQYRWLIAHEVAHQYFGSAIGIERREIAWAPIGLGMTMDHAYLVNRGLDDSAARKTSRWFYLEALRRGFDTTLSQPVEKPMASGPPWSSGWNMSLMHGKAYEVCAMLEGLLGEDRFRQMLRKILLEQKGDVLSADEFVRYCKAASPEPLDWFVADWIDGNGALDYEVSRVSQVAGACEVEISKVGMVAYPVIVEAQSTGGRKLRQQIDPNKNVNRLSFAITDKLKSVVIDPEGNCPDLDETNNKWPK